MAAGKNIKAKECKLYHCSECNNMIAKSNDLIISHGEISVKCEKCGTFNQIK
ncbi:Com family DNA-binding transcriptional regulator [Mycoplasmatota bacterium]|nr:Com family DNA-binding transcriptional regulator [Mycoplasmatota bacterium]